MSAGTRGGASDGSAGRGGGEGPQPPGCDARRWDDKWRARGEPGAPSPWLLSIADELPTSGRALDVAGGAGRHAIWLAQRGLDVTLCDVSEVALALAVHAGRTVGVQMSTLRMDLEEHTLPPGPWDAILCYHYLQRQLITGVASALAPGGRFVFCQPTVTNLERHDQPSERFLLGNGEILALISGLQIVRYEEGWGAEGRHEARLIATRAAP